MSYQEALEFFELKEGYSEDELRGQHTKFTKLYHPDPHENEGPDIVAKYNKMMQKVNEANRILRNKLKGKPVSKEEIQREISKLKANWLRDINNLKATYKNSPEIKKICNNYEKILIKLETLNELKLQFAKFNQEIEDEKNKIVFKKEVEAFTKELKKEIASNKNDIYIKLATLYLEKLDGTFLIDDLQILEKEYHKAVQREIQQEGLKKITKEKSDFLIKLNAYQKQYSDTATVNLVTEFIKKVTNVDSLLNLNTLSNEFFYKFNRIRLVEKQFLDKKKKVLNQFTNYQGKNYSKEYHDLSLKYQDELTKIQTIADLEALNKQFNSEIKKLRDEEKRKMTNFSSSKESLKKVVVYNFYLFLLKSSGKQFEMAIDIYKSLLLLIEKVTFQNLKEIMDLVDQIKFNNLPEEKNKIDFYLLSKDTRIKNSIDIKKLFDEIQTDTIDSESDVDSSLKQKIMSIIVLNYYNFASHESIQDILASIEDLRELLQVIDNMNDNDLYDNLSFLENLNFKNIDMLREKLESFRPASNIFIHFLTGDICTLKKLDNDNIMALPIDTTKGVSIIPTTKKEEYFISVNDFFKKATFTNGFDVLERVDRYNTHARLFTDGRFSLYSYRRLLLEYYTPSGHDNFDPYFTFSVSRSPFGWKVVDTLPVHNAIYANFKNRETCQNAFMDQVLNDIEKANLQEERHRK